MIKLFKATLSDVSAMQNLVIDEVKDGVILNRTDDEVATNIRSYILAKDTQNDNKLVGYAALHVHSIRLAELRSFIVDKAYRGKKVGESLVKYILKEAKALDIKEDVLVLTYLPIYFEKLGFVEINKELIPEQKIWTDCIKCIHFPVCNEIALVYKIV